MADTQRINITVSIPADVFAAIQNGTATELDMKKTTDAIVQCIRPIPGHCSIAVRHLDTLYKLRVSLEGKVSQIWEQLERECGFRRGNRVLCLAGKKVDEEVELGKLEDFDHKKVTMFYIVPGDFWTATLAGEVSV